MRSSFPFLLPLRLWRLPMQLELQRQAVQLETTLMLLVINCLAARSLNLWLRVDRATQQLRMTARSPGRVSRHRWSLIVSVLLSVPGAMAAGDDANVPDPELRKVLEKILRKKDVKEKFFTTGNLKKIWFLDASNRNIEDITGLEHCCNLGEVRLNGNAIRDVSPLGELRNVQSLNLADNRIVDPAPLGKIKKLQYLRLDGNAIEKVGGLVGLEALNVLHLGRNRINDIRPLARLNDLWTLKLDSNQIEDISALAELRADSLDLAHNRISDVSPLKSQLYLTFTFLQGNRISDISPLVEMARADVEGEQRFAPYWKLYLAENPLNAESKKMLQELRSIGVRLNMEYIGSVQENSPQQKEPATVAVRDVDSDS